MCRQCTARVSPLGQRLIKPGNAKSPINVCFRRSRTAARASMRTGKFQQIARTPLGAECKKRAEDRPGSAGVRGFADQLLRKREAPVDASNRRFADPTVS